MSTTITTAPAVHDFASAVRAALSDLPDDDVDDLTEGLEADLSERLDDTGAELGDPLAYAEELRTAAGLPPRETQQRGSWLSQAGVGLHSLRGAISRTIRSTAVGSAVLDFFISLRPVWWVLRGVGLYAVVKTVFSIDGGLVQPNSFFSTLLLLGLVVLSVQWGRKGTTRRSWIRPFAVVLSAIALLFVPGTFISLLQQQAAGSYDTYQPYATPPGLTFNGLAVSNIFAYDENGELISDVQLFDQAGNPLRTVDSNDLTWQWQGLDDQGREVGLVPNGRAPGRAGWSVFPLNKVFGSDVDYSDTGIGVVNPDRIIPVTPPFAKAQPLAPRVQAEKAADAPVDASTPPTPPATDPPTGTTAFGTTAP